MVYEFAVEPQLLSRWDQFRYIVEKFDVAQGRLISRFPKEWIKMVYDSLVDCKDVEKAKIEESLRRIDHRLLNTIRIYDPDGPTWLENAEMSHLQKPFRAILARNNPKGNIEVIDGRSLDESSALWNIPDPSEVPRSAADIAAAVGPFIKMGDALILIDPHVRLYERRYSNPLGALLDASRRGDGSFPKRLEVHIGFDPEDERGPGLDWLVEKCEQYLPRIVPAGAALKLKILTQRKDGKKLHNRYLLTDIGAIKVDPGLDEGEEGEHFELIRLG